MNMLKFLALAAGLSFLAVSAVVADGRPASSSAKGDYVVGIEDRLGVVVWKQLELSQTVTVRPDGKITLPLINDIAVAGKTPAQIRDEISASLSEFVRDPNVTVIVEQINSFRVYFLGEINNQGALQFYRPTRLLQAIASAGGLTEFAKKEIVLLRDENGAEKRIPIDYKRLLAGDPAQENLYVMPGDTLLFN